jgi:serine/threonine-protein kinase
VSEGSPPSTQEPRLAIGDVAVKAYGKYYLVKKLAEGGMAEIFLAKQVGVEGFEKNVVIKRMLPHLSGTSDFVSMFLDEARLAASLTHPNIVQISDLGLADGCYFICMEYLAGEDFATVLRTAKRRGEHAPLNVVLRVLAEAAVGLHYAHEAVDQRGEPLNLVHRDISPSNIFVTYGGQVKVLDFGIAKAESRVTSTGAGVVKGKYQYMSPEQARGDTIDRRSDIFALGVSLFEALSGVRPFARDTDLAVLKAVLGSEHQPIRALRPDLPLEVEQIVNKAMAPEAADRYPTALAFAQDIERFIGATTSASGGQSLQSFMANFFGPERVKSKVRIESLEELAARGVDVPGRVNPLSPKTEAGAQRTHSGEVRTAAATRADLAERTNAIGAPLAVQQEASRRSSRLVLAAVAALVLGVGGTVVVMKLLNPPSPPPSVVTPPVTTPVVVAPPVPTPPVEVDAGSAAEVDAGVAEVVDAGVPVGPTTPPKAGRPVTLTTAMVQKGVAQARPRIQQCFKVNKAELPSAQGTLMVNFVIAGSGKVTAVSTDRAGTAVSKCIEAAVRSVTYPRHVDLEVRVPIALNWDVR